MLALSTLWPTQWPVGKDELELLGLLGDYLGGVVGTFISLATILIIYFTFRNTRRTNYFNNIVSILTQMLITQDQIMNQSKSSISRILEEFSQFYKISKDISPINGGWSIQERIDICYIFAFYGTSSNSSSLLSIYGSEQIKAIHDEASRLRARADGKFEGWFHGHQATLSHFFRNIFSMYVFIEQSDLKTREKMALGKIIRSKLSNYEQAVLLLNTVSRLGRDWEREGLVETYKPFANVPRDFFGVAPEFVPKEYFPTIEFEWERLRDQRPRYRILRFGRRSLTLTVFDRRSN